MQSAQDIPHLRKTVNSQQLIVRGKPFLCLGGELHNSSMSNAEFMRGVWPNMKAMNVNTLLGGVHWEMIEPTEGSFDFEELDQMILDARGHGLHLVLLWFGSFKNARSTYVPAWVKEDHKRFPRIHAEVDRKKETLELLSPFHSPSREADAKAFAALMRHIREFDGAHSTVIMVQEAFGKGITAEEVFMAHGFSNYIGHVAAAGKAEYPIPLFTNTWINFDEPSTLDLSASLGPHRSLVAAGGVKPGMYPSGGPYPHVMDVWKFNAPSLDFLSPDVYFHNYEWVCQQYRYQNQPLFIPEQKRDEAGARRMFLAFGTYGAVGCSPFGIDTLEAATSPMTRVYRLLQSMSKHILDAQANRPDDMMGFFFDEDKEDEDEPEKWVKVFGDFELTIARSFVFGKPGSFLRIISMHLESVIASRCRELFRTDTVAAHTETTRLQNSASRDASPSASRRRKLAQCRTGLTQWTSSNQSWTVSAITCGGPSRSRPAGESVADEECVDAGVCDTNGADAPCRRRAATYLDPSMS